VRAPDEQELKLVHSGLAQSIQLADPERLLTQARECNLDAIAVLRAGIAGDPNDSRLIELLTEALQSPDRATRQAAAEVAVIRRPQALAMALRAAAAREGDEDLSAAFAYAGERCELRQGSDD
jgi:hypothetical protein